MNKSAEHTRTHTRTHTCMHTASPHTTCLCLKTMHASVHLLQLAADQVCACVLFVRVCVCVYVWALGFSLADVSNQSLSRGSLSLYPLSVKPWVD